MVSLCNSEIKISERQICCAGVVNETWDGLDANVYCCEQVFIMYNDMSAITTTYYVALRKKERIDCNEKS